MKFSASRGKPLPLGVSRQAEGYNFSVFSRHASQVVLVFFRPGENAIWAEIPLSPIVNRTGDIWHILIHDLDPAMRYGYRVNGANSDHGHCFDPRNILLDPYARAVSGNAVWGRFDARKGPREPGRHYRWRGCLVDDDFDWHGDRPLQIPWQDTIIYEAHVRSFTRHASSGVRHPGTYRGLVEKIPYLQELGITAVELLPISEFNELEIAHNDPVTGKPLRNLWGYSPMAFFAPKAGYASCGRDGGQVREFKEMVRSLHRAGIELILDVVFNHTAEGGGNGPVISFRGFDNAIYYLLDPETREHLNFSGCGNTLNCNHPVVQKFIIDCLRYWVTEMHVDGFRFDLAAILGRDQQGRVLDNAPMIERIAEDPVLRNTKIIAEAWDAGGLYQVGSFSRSARWAEWNGRFRDDIRLFFSGRGRVADLATRFAGSSDLYQASGRRPYNSINFITSHDGFTLADLVSYNKKHNQRNGEGNRDGEDNNLSWNSGVEGPSRNRKIEALRRRRMKSMAVLLLLAQGVPMLTAGDEVGRSQQGNNNAYCQDNAISWFDWRLVERNRDLLRFFQQLIRLRREHAVFRRSAFFQPQGPGGEPEVLWFDHRGVPQGWLEEERFLGCYLSGRGIAGRRDWDFLLLINGDDRERNCTLPGALATGRCWRHCVATDRSAPDDIVADGSGPEVDNVLTVPAFATVVLVNLP